MFWDKKGLIYNGDKRLGEDFSAYARFPVVDVVNETVWRIYFSSTSDSMVSYPFYLDVEAGNPFNILNVSNKPLLMPGDRGTFDDSGITSSCVVDVDGAKYLYYVGWNKRVSVPCAVNIGLAISEDGGNTFKKAFKGAIVDRNRYDSVFTTVPCVIKDGGTFRMWYISCLCWQDVNGRMQPLNVIKHAESKDGIDWEINDDVCIASLYPEEALGRPWVIKEDGLYKMWFSAYGAYSRKKADEKRYMIAYAESKDGIHWERRPDPYVLDLSEDGWDSEMLQYCSVFKDKETKYMFYSGNGFGKTGFGLAVCGGK